MATNSNRHQFWLSAPRRPAGYLITVTICMAGTWSIVRVIPLGFDPIARAAVIAVTLPCSLPITTGACGMRIGDTCRPSCCADGKLERLSGTATVLRLFEEWECSVAEVQLAAGDTL